MEKTWRDLTLSVNMPANLAVEALDEKRVRFRLDWDEPGAEKPVLAIGWQVPLVDIQHEWYPTCRFDRSLRVDWQGPVKSKISSSAPVYCFYNAAARNRLTVALSDVYTQLGCALGVREEDGMLLCRVEIPLDATGASHAYAVTLYRDRDDVSFSEALRRVSAWWEADCGLTPMPVPEEAREAMYSTWYSYHQATVAADIEAECARAAAMGFRTVIVDDGWQTGDGQRGYAYCGDWEPCPEKIPDMKAHVAAVHALGMKYMLWYSVPFMGYRSKHWDSFKGKLLCRVDRMGAGVLDPRYPDVRAYLIDTYARALKAWDLDGFKLDFIDSFSPGQDPLPAPTPEMDYALVEDAVNRLMTDVMKALRAVKPDILIEFRQSYIGPAMRTFGNMFRVGDCPADPISNRVGTVDLRLLSGSTAVHSDMLMWHRDDRAEAAARQILSVIFAVPQISVRLDALTEEHRRMLAFWLDFMRRHRELLRAPLEAQAPQNLYPVVTAQKDGEAVIALYDGGRIVDLPPDARTLWLLNAAPDTRVVLASAAPR
ncbi:MAG: alpha-galactosidase, partial [Clostridia bacterium]|nr:alpha-galactosidase [Clostridia bacterium]